MCYSCLHRNRASGFCCIFLVLQFEQRACAVCLLCTGNLYSLIILPFFSQKECQHRVAATTTYIQNVIKYAEHFLKPLLIVPEWVQSSLDIWQVPSLPYLRFEFINSLW